MFRRTIHRPAPDDESRVARFTRSLLLVGIILMAAGVLYVARYALTP
jgi:hypothetical protein